MGGPRLTPAQMERAAQVFAETGNTSEAARAIGVGESTLREAFKREKIAKNRELHAQACEAGIRAARKRLRRVAEIAERVIASNDTDGVGVEPRDLAALVNALSKNTDTLLAVAARNDSRKQAALTRKKTRAEIAVLERKLSGEPDRVSIEHTTDDALDSRIAELIAAVRPAPPDEGAEG